MQIEHVITLGNLIVILIAIVGFVATTIVNITVMSAKTSRFVVMTEMKFQAGEKKFIEIEKDLGILDKKCIICPQKTKLEVVEKTANDMYAEQIRLRAVLPVQLDKIERSIADLKMDFGELKVDLSKLREDLTLSKALIMKVNNHDA